MSSERRSTERDLTETLRSVAEQTPVADDDGFESIRRSLVEIGRPDELAGGRMRRSRIGSVRPRQMAIAAAVAVIVGFGLVATILLPADGPQDQQRITAEPPAPTTPTSGAPATAQSVDDAPVHPDDAAVGPPLRVLPEVSLPGYSLDVASAVSPVDPSPAECIGCLDLRIVPDDWVPFGVRPSIDISVQPPGFTSPADAEPLTVRGNPAMMTRRGPAGSHTVLTWTEDDDLSFVVAFVGYDLSTVLDALDGLLLVDTDGDGLADSVDHPDPPAGSRATRELIDGRVALLQYSSSDGDRVSVRIIEYEPPLDESARETIRADVAVTLLNDDDRGVGAVHAPAAGADGDPELERVVQWWSVEGFLVHVDGGRSSLGLDELAAFAASFQEVSAEVWAAAGGT